MLIRSDRPGPGNQPPGSADHYKGPASARCVRHVDRKLVMVVVVVVVVVVVGGGVGGVCE